MKHDPFPWPTHAPDCGCVDCETYRTAEPTLADDAGWIARWCLAGLLTGLALVAAHGWVTGAPGLRAMVGL